MPPPDATQHLLEEGDDVPSPTPRRRALLTRRRALGAVILSAALALAAVPVSAQEASGQDSTEELADEQAQLAADEAELARVEQAIADAEAQVRAAEEALAGAARELRALEEQVAEARAVVAGANREHDAAVRAHTLSVLAAVEARRVAALRQDELDAQAADLYMHATEQQHALSLGSVLRADSPHDALVALRAARSTTKDRDDAARAAEQARLAARAARTEAEAARGAAVTALVRAEDAELEVATLEAQQAGVVQRLTGVRATASAALEALDDDRAVVEALVARRRERVAALQTAVDAALAAGVADGSWVSRLPAGGQRWAPSITAAATEAGVDPRLLAALVWTESGFVPDAVSHAGALGLTQLMPGTAQGLGVDPRDPEQNLRGGARYLRAQVGRFGSVELGLAAYNAGPGRVVEAGNQVPPIVETQLYVPRVLERFTRLAG